MDIDQEVAKGVDLALRQIISDLVISNTELKVRVKLLMESATAEKETKKSPALKAVQD